MNSTLTPTMDETLHFMYVDIFETYIKENIKAYDLEYYPWVFAVLGSILIGLSGIVPLLIIPADVGGGDDFKDREYYYIG